jgi:lipoprotein-anchoring transpeptidase ErfK/SrfK
MPVCRAAIILMSTLLAVLGSNACRTATPPLITEQPAVSARGRGTDAVPESPLQTRLVIRVSQRRLYLIDDAPDTPDESFPIAVGRQGLETPVGQFHVEEMVENPDFDKIASGVVIERIPPGPSNPLGVRWIGFAHGPGWTIGIHGTPTPDLLGRAVSSGCVRMRNADVIRVYERVRIGTPVVVEP